MQREEQEQQEIQEDFKKISHRPKRAAVVRF